jgi:hypothetical protein
VEAAAGSGINAGAFAVEEADAGSGMTMDVVDAELSTEACCSPTAGEKSSPTARLIASGRMCGAAAVIDHAGGPPRPPFGVVESITGDATAAVTLTPHAMQAAQTNVRQACSILHLLQTPPPRVHVFDNTSVCGNSRHRRKGMTSTAHVRGLRTVWKDPDVRHRIVSRFQSRTRLAPTEDGPSSILIEFCKKGNGQNGRRASSFGFERAAVDSLQCRN